MTTNTITSLDALSALYPDPPVVASIAKEIDHVDENYGPLIEASPFMLLATSGPDGLDCSPRGDQPGFVRIRDAKTLLIPDRRGNNRLDSLKNILSDPRVGMLFLIPGYGETLRVNGTATVSDDPELCASFEMAGRRPACVIVVNVERVYFQCSRAVVRADLWNPATHVAKGDVPSAGAILRNITAKNDAVETFDGEAYDKALPERVKATLY